VFVLRPDSKSDPGPVASGTAPSSATAASRRPASPSALKPGRAPIDPTGRWTGSSVSTDGQYTYQVTLELQGDPDNPNGTVRMRNLVTGNEGSWEVKGTWSEGRLDLEPGDWLDQPNSSWTREALLLVPLTDSRMNGTTAQMGSPGDPTGDIDLYR
jgi:hypothetical protein